MPRVIWSGNIGEWGEAFALMHLLAHNRLYNADSHGRRIASEYGDVEAIYRTEASGLELELVVCHDDIKVIQDGCHVFDVPKCDFAQAAHNLFLGMRDQGTTAEHPEQEFLKQLGCERLKASSLMKADMSALIRDGSLSSKTQRDFSIKTVVGGDPSLANASGQSYIDYELPGFDADKADEVMSIEGRSWVIERTRAVLSLCDAPPVPVIRSSTFQRNLRRCYWCAPEVVGLALMYGQLHRGKPMIDSIADLEAINPLGFEPDEYEDYEVAVRRYLWGVVFDLDPGQPWHGPSQVDGYLLVTDEEEVLAYQVSRQRSFEDYLLLHTHWDTPSTSRYRDIGRVWQREDGQWMYTLNCVVRYNAREYTRANAALVGIDK